MRVQTHIVPCYQLITILGMGASQWAASLLTTTQGYNSTPPVRGGEMRVHGTTAVCGQGHSPSPRGHGARAGWALLPGCLG